ncbi:MAG: hypothetical protein GXP45_05265 [bacterium]|nr:hypothetical protein [bacterium]
MVDYIIKKLFDSQKMDYWIKSFRKDDILLEEFLMYISDYKLFKRNFFS